MRWLAAFGRFWWDFVVGDDWRLAAGALTALAAGGLLAATRAASDGVISAAVTAGIVATVGVALARRS